MHPEFGHCLIARPADPESIVARVLETGRGDYPCLLDGCGMSPESNLLIAGVGPASIIEIEGDDPAATLARIENAAARHPFLFFTLSYDFGLRLNSVVSRFPRSGEPDLFLASFDTVLLHEYSSNSTHLVGNPDSFRQFEDRIFGCDPSDSAVSVASLPRPVAGREEYLEKIAKIKELIRSGHTYQTNLTQTFIAPINGPTQPAEAFRRLRRLHPAPFAAYLRRRDSTVVSASPERFFRIIGRRVEASPIKGTRRRGLTPETDARLRDDLVRSGKDRAENIMIVDLLRNDLGRVSEFGSVAVDRLCEVETHASIYHLVSTISARLRNGCGLADVIRATFPCGSITGAPKISTMRIIDAIEDRPRGLSMGAIGYFAPRGLGVPGLEAPRADLSVAIRTMVIRDGAAEFNVGGGIVIDSDPDDEYRESLLKAAALVTALGADSADLREQTEGFGV